MSDQFSPHIERVARHYFGEPNPRLSTATELRWGAHGSLSVDLDKGVFFDHEADKGGGVLDLIARETGAKNGAAVEVLKTEFGVQLEEREPTRPRENARIVRIYTYTDEDGCELYDAVRFEPKRFAQRRPANPQDDPAKVRNGYVWSLGGVRLVPYHLPALLAAKASRRVFIVEGEKDVEALQALGLVATCNPMGAGKWPADFAAYFKDRLVTILPDNDAPGRDHAAKVSAALVGVAASLKIVELPNLPPKGDVTDWLNGGGDKATLIELDAAATEITLERPPSRFGAITWDMIDKVPSRTDLLVEDLLFCGDSALMFGESGSGKSFAATNLGLSIARGVEFLGKRTTPGLVIYQAGEGGKGLVNRLKAYRDHHQVFGARLPFVLLPERVDLFSDDGDTDAFIEECLMWAKAYPETPLQAVFIDTLSTASLGANENASEDMGRLLIATDQIRKATGAAVIWVHHKNAGGVRERGHTSLRANMDTAIEVVRDEKTDIRTLKLAKMKDGQDNVSLLFELKAVKIGDLPSGKPLTSCVVDPLAASKRPISEKAKFRVPPAHLIFMQLLDEVTSSLGQVVPPETGAKHGTYGVEWKTFHVAYKDERSVTLEDNAIRQALVRDSDTLKVRGLIGKAFGWVWLTELGLQTMLQQVRNP